MSIKDVIKKSILESEMFKQTIAPDTILTIVLDLLFSLLMGLFIYLVYKHYFKGVVYSKNFSITLVGMSVLTCMVTLAISTNIVISLGMVGALSIVRYRTAIKEPLDLMYVFWAITVGITSGASMYILGVLASTVMFLIIVGFSHRSRGKQSYVVVVHYKGNTTGDEIMRLLARQSFVVRSKVSRGEEIELTLQLRCKPNYLNFSERLTRIPEVSDVTIMDFNGEYHG